MAPAKTILPMRASLESGPPRIVADGPRGRKARPGQAAEKKRRRASAVGAGTSSGKKWPASSA